MSAGLRCRYNPKQGRISEASLSFVFRNELMEIARFIQVPMASLRIAIVGHPLTNHRLRPHGSGDSISEDLEVKTADQINGHVLNGSSHAWNEHLC